MEDIHLIYITTKNAEEAEKIGTILVKEKLAACANILPQMLSIYEWEGKLEKESVALLLLKTKQSLVKDLIQRTKELHSYTVPCIVSYKAGESNEVYLDWIRNSL